MVSTSTNPADDPRVMAVEADRKRRDSEVRAEEVRVLARVVYVYQRAARVR